MGSWAGDYRPHAHLSAKNLCNALLALVCMAPSLSAAFERARCWPFATAAASASGAPASAFLALVGVDWCELAIWRPLFSVNVLFFWNVTVGFWLIGCVQRSFWLIDPFWTLLPPLIGAFYATHPNADADAPSRQRQLVGLALVGLWSTRLTHSYFRREEWKFGQREDWRYTEMSRARPLAWWVLSFFAVGLAQQPMLVGLSLPLHATCFGGDARPLGVLDACAVLGCLTGLLVARAADDQLAAFMAANAARAAKGQPRVLLLESGLWRYSRHPNYFGETLFWTSLGLLGAAAGQPWVLCGAAFNTLVLISVTFMTEGRMLARPERRAAYERYIRTTSAWIPRAKFVDRT